MKSKVKYIFLILAIIIMLPVTIFAQDSQTAINQVLVHIEQTIDPKIITMTDKNLEQQKEYLVNCKTEIKKLLEQEDKGAEEYSEFFNEIDKRINGCTVLLYYREFINTRNEINNKIYMETDIMELYDYVKEEKALQQIGQYFRKIYNFIEQNQKMGIMHGKVAEYLMDKEEDVRTATVRN